VKKVIVEEALRLLKNRLATISDVLRSSGVGG
jgi:hypothetical protein